MRALLLAVALAGCGGGVNTFDLAAPDAGGGDTGIAYERCESYCIRPSDCAIGFASDEICPGGFLCATHFMCSSDASSDGGAHD